MQNNREISVAVLGVGLMGSAHAYRLHEHVKGARVVAVSDYDSDRAQSVADHIPGCRVIQDPFEAISADDVDAVVIATPAASHEELLLATIARRMPAFCEKPLGDTPSSARRVLHAEAETGQRLVQLGFMRRYDPEYEELKRRIGAGEIGVPLTLATTVRTTSVPPTFTSEMIITDAAVHDFDMSRHLLDEEVAAITVHAARPSPNAHAGLQDPLVIVCRMRSGALSILSICMSSGLSYETRTEVLGSTGALEMGQETGVMKRTGQGTREFQGEPGFIKRFSNAYLAELQLFIKGVQSGNLSGPSTWDGYAAAAVCEAGVEALQTGQPVEVVLDRAPAMSGLGSDD